MSTQTNSSHDNSLASELSCIFYGTLPNYFLPFFFGLGLYFSVGSLIAKVNCPAVSLKRIISFLLLYKISGRQLFIFHCIQHFST
jgi:hypothetical protein